MKRKLINLIAGRKSLQKLFELLYSASVYGMNYGNGGNFRSSGELFAAKYIKGKLNRLTEPYTFFDGGANKGQYSMELAHIFSDKAFSKDLDINFKTGFVGSTTILSSILFFKLSRN